MLKDHPLLKEFCDCNPNFPDELNALPGRYQNKFIRKFNKENDRIEFLSKISELKFAQFFIEKGFDFDYEPNVVGKTPDFKIRIGETEIIADVKRFNLSEEDQVKQRFFYQLATELKKITLPYHVTINQLQVFYYELFDVTEIKSKFHDWLKENPVEVGQIFNYNDLFEIRIINIKGIKNYILFSYRTKENKIHPSKIMSIVSEKLVYYKDSIIDKGYLFFVCLDLLFDSMLEPDDFIMKYRGCGVLDIDDGSESTFLGEFYTNEQYSNVIGLLIRYNGTFIWIRNYRHQDYLEL